MNIYGQFIFEKVPRQLNGNVMVSLINGAETTEYLHLKDWRSASTSDYIQKSYVDILYGIPQASEFWSFFFIFLFTSQTGWSKLT